MSVLEEALCGPEVTESDLIYLDLLIIITFKPSS